MSAIRTINISDRDYEKIRSPLTTVLILSNDRGNFSVPGSTALATLTLFFEIVCPLFETAILLDQLKTALIEPTYETLEGLNVFLRLVERRHL